MSESMQGAVVGLIVAAAVLYLLRQYLPRRRKPLPGAASKQDGCGSCGSCKGGGCH